MQTLVDPGWPPDGTASQLCVYLTDHSSLANRYLQWYYCTYSSHPTLANTGLIAFDTALIILLFLSLGILASDYLSPNLTFLSGILHLDEKMAGLTLLALANGAPDIASTFAAMNSHSASLAIGELLGSANFELTMVIGCMALVKPFTVEYTNVIRDLALFGVLIVISLLFLSDGKITMAESITLIALYFVFIAINWLRPERMIEEALEDVETATHNEVISPLSGTLSAGTALMSPTNTRMAHFAQNVENLEQGKTYRLPLVDALKLRLGTQSLDKITSAHSDPAATIPHLTAPIQGSGHTHTPKEGLPRLTVSVDDLPNPYSHTVDSPHPVFHTSTSLLPPGAEDDATSYSSTSSTASSPSAILSMAGMPTPEITPESSLVFLVVPRWRDIYCPGRFWDTLLNCVTVPFSTVFNLCIAVPVREELQGEDRNTEVETTQKLFAIQIAVLPILLRGDLSWPTLLASAILAAANLLFRKSYPKVYNSSFEYVSGFCGFAAVLVCISRTASGIVRILKDIGFVFGIKDSLLGLTVLALGNSVGDLVTNTTLASLGFALTGLHACFGSPLLYTLFGIGLNSIIANFGDYHGPITFEVDTSLKITAYSIIFTLLFYMVTIPSMGWKVNRTIGGIGVGIWVVVTALNAYVSTH